MNLTSRFLLLFSVICFAACGGSSKPNNTPPPTSTPQATSTPRPVTPSVKTNTLQIKNTIDTSPLAGNLITAGNNCLDVSGPDLFKSAGGKVQLWGCNNSPNQQWWFVSNRLVNGGGRCLVFRGGQISSGDCSKANSRKWKIVNGSVLMHSSNKCLTVTEDKQRGQVQVANCTGQAGQVWRFEKTANIGRLLMGDSQCLDVNGPDLFKSADGKVQTWNCSGSTNQRWWLLEDRMVSAGGRCLTVMGTQVKSADCHKTDDQKWGVNNGRLMNASGKCLDIPVAKVSAKGTAVQVADCSSSAGQRWQYEGSGVGNTQIAARKQTPEVTKSPATTPVTETTTPEVEQATKPETTTTDESIEVVTVPEPEGTFNGIVAAHNKIRAEVGVGPMQWSDTIAAYAQEWAEHLQANENCALKHRGAGRRYGENIAGGGAISPAVAVQLWGGEKAFYNGENHTCQANKVCGHYTQIVWRNSTEIGCGMASCSGKAILVCNYNPPGNYIGQRPY